MSEPLPHAVIESCLCFKFDGCDNPNSDVSQLSALSRILLHYFKEFPKYCPPQVTCRQLHHFNRLLRSKRLLRSTEYKVRWTFVRRFQELPLILVKWNMSLPNLNCLLPKFVRLPIGSSVPFSFFTEVANGHFLSVLLPFHLETNFLCYFYSSTWLSN